ncbi:TPA: tail fiber domain-containing protein [Stenotrophomonas maltophilia]
MDIEIIDLDTPQPGGKVGDPARVAFGKVNDNFSAVGAALPEKTANEFVFSGTDITEISLGIRNDGGGTPVLHYHFKHPTAGFPGAGQLVGGAGSRPWTGGSYSDHSTAAYHLIATQSHTASAQGTDFRILATPIGATQSGRVYVANFNGDGDVILSKGATQRKVVSEERGRGMEIARDSSPAEVSLVSNYPGFGALIRGYGIGGTVAAPSSTPASSAVGIGLCGHDGTAYVGSKGIVALVAAANWTPTSTPTFLALETTSVGSNSRVRRWVVTDSGHFQPSADNTYDLGSGSSRVRQIYSNNSAISTSDAELKTSPRDLSAEELAAFSEIGRLPMLWRWLSKAGRGADEGRLHAGPTVQAAIAVMENHGLDWRHYGCFCHDSWQAEDATLTEEGEVVRPARDAGEIYGLRKDELLFLVTRAIISELDEMRNSA